MKLYLILWNYVKKNIHIASISFCRLEFVFKFVSLYINLVLYLNLSNEGIVASGGLVGEWEGEGIMVECLHTSSK